MAGRTFFLSRAVLGGALGSLLWGAVLLGACEQDPPPKPTGSQSGTAGGGGSCPNGPQPMFTLTIAAEDGPLPPDTSLEVTWSAGPEPVFALDDPSTWGTPEQGANVVCDIGPTGGPPPTLEQLKCDLWTSGPTEIVVKGDDYAAYKDTLVPMQSEICEGPIPTEVEIKLTREVDGGGPP